MFVAVIVDMTPEYFGLDYHGIADLNRDGDSA